MIKRIATSLLFMLAIASTSFAQSDSERDQYAPNVVEFAAKTFTFTHVEATGHFSLAHQWELVWTGTPTTTTISVVGRMRGGTTVTLSTSSSTANQIITTYGFYDFIDVNIAWTGAGPTAFKLNVLGSARGWASSSSLAANGAAPVGNPTLISGIDTGGAVQRDVLVNGQGALVNSIALADTDATPNNPVADTVGNLGPNGPLRVTLHAFDGGSNAVPRLHTQSATNTNNSFMVGVLQADVPGQWAITAQPGAATQATTNRPAVASTKHVAKSITVCISAVAAQPDIIFNLRDGASGAGTVVWTVRMAATAGTSQCQTAYFTIIGSNNTAMAVESAAAPAATNFASVSLSGYDIQ